MVFLPPPHDGVMREERRAGTLINGGDGDAGDGLGACVAKKRMASVQKHKPLSLDVEAPVGACM